MDNPTITPSSNEKPRQRLFRQYRRLHSWRKLAERLGVNVLYVYNFAQYGIEPTNDEISARLGIRRKKNHHRTINDHLSHDSISDMPGDLLLWAYQHREPVQ